MAVIYQDKKSDTPYVETVWYVEAVQDGCDTVVADVSWDMLIMTRKGKTDVTIWGPMTQSAQIPHNEGDTCLGIRFKLGTFAPHFPADKLLNVGMILPDATRSAFWLGDSTWEIPTYENVDTFIGWLAHDGLLVRDPVVDAVLEGNSDEAYASARSVQRRFLQATGLPQRSIRQIERAQQAAELLKRGIPIQDTVYEAGYFDQAHLTKALQRFLGQTPGQILCSHGT